MRCILGLKVNKRTRERLVSKETVVKLRRWGGETLKSGHKQVDKGSVSEIMKLTFQAPFIICSDTKFK